MSKQQTIFNQTPDINCKLTHGYSRGAYNKIKEDGTQWIRISEGCPNNCSYCGETKVNGIKPVYYPIPEIKSNYVKILDMNLIYKPKALEIIKELGSKKFNNKMITYELVCGIDYRYLTEELAVALKENGFKIIRFAWDSGYKNVWKMYDTIALLEKVGFKREQMQVFMIANYIISFREYLRKMQSLLYWHIQISDCWFDNQKKGNVKPIFWTKKEIELVSSMCSEHNVMCRANGVEVRKKNETKNKI